MRAYLPAGPDRTLTTATSPPLTEGPDAYRKKRSPTLVIRREGSAWDQPFLTVYESAIAGEYGIMAVDQIEVAQKVAGARVLLDGPAGNGAQYILAPSDPEQETDYGYLKYRFQGRYAVVTTNQEGALTSIYIGAGKKLAFGERELRSADGEDVSAFVDFSGAQPKVTTSQPLYLRDAAGKESLFNPD